MRAKDRSRATRYGGGEDDDAAAVALVSMGPPAMCAVFALPDPDEAIEEVVKAAEEERIRFKGIMRSLNLNVQEMKNKDRTLCFFKLSAPDTMLRYEAQEKGVRLRLREHLGSALCKYTGELEAKKAFMKTSDGFELFCSQQQLTIIEEVSRTEPWRNDGEEKLKFEFEAKISAYFPLHHERIRLKLISEWSTRPFNPQPLEIIREYFGEKHALFWTWFGFYITMLWIPGILGAILFVLQVQDFLEVNSMENPYMLVYGVVLCLWTSAFTCLWKSLEKTRQFEWDTVAFEEQEELRREFMEDEKTEQGKHDNEVTGEKDRYYFDEGEYFPIPTGRSREKAWTYAVILLVDIFILFLQTFLWQMLHPLLDVEDNVAGSVMYGVASSFVIWGVDLIMDGVPELSFEGIVDRLTNNENWDTFTRYEDALIMHTFMYKMVNKFFPLIWVAFLANNVKVSGQYWRCYNWECYPVLSIVLVTQIILLQILYYVQIYVFPALRKMMSSEGKPAPPSGMRVIRAPMEIQYEWHNPTAVVDYYMVLVYQLGYVALFGLACPVVPLLCNVVNMFELRRKANSLLCETRRPNYECASDIGTYQQVIDVFAVLSIITTSGVLGITTHGLYFYFPDMSMADCMWATLVVEHLLFLGKLFLESVIPTEPAEARANYELQQETKVKILTNWNIPDPETY